MKTYVIKILPFILALLCVKSLNAQTSYTWDGSSSTDWNTAANWTPATVPGSGDHIVLNTGSGNQPVLDANRSITNITVSAGTLNLNGYTLTITGTTSLTGGTINNGTATFNNLGTTINGTTFGAKVNVTSAAYNVTLSNSTFNEVVDAEGAIVSVYNSIFNKKIVVKYRSWYGYGTGGGNTFNDTLDFRALTGSTNGGTSYPYISEYYGTNNFNGHIIVSHNATVACYLNIGGDNMSATGTSTLASGKKILIGTGGFASGGLGIYNLSSTTDQNITLGNSVGLAFGSAGGNYSSHTGKMNLEAGSLTMRGIFNRVVAKVTGSSTVSWYGAIFNDTLDIKLQGSSSINTNGCKYNGDVYISNTGSGTLRLGYDSYANIADTLAAGKKMLTGTSGFTNGILIFETFKQLGTGGIINLNLTSSSSLYVTPGIAFTGPVTFSAPDIYVEGVTFGDTAHLTKTGSSANTWYTANTYNGNAFITNNGSGALTLSSLASGGDTYNANATFTKSSSGNINIAGNNSTVTFKGDVTLSGISNTQFTSSQSTLFSGTASQTLTSSTALSFGNVTINKASNNLTLNSVLNILSALTLTSGKVITTSTYLLNFNDNATVSGASNTSHVQGPVSKTGNDAFTFPVGKAGSYRPIGISTPVSGTSTATVFTADYINSNQTLGATIDTSIVNLSDCEYWTFTRSGSSATVNITLSWNSASCNRATAANMRVAGWDGSTWSSYGNASNSGTASAGTVTGSSAPATYIGFALSTKRCTTTATISGTLLLCEGTSTTLTANSALRYKWSTTAITQAITVSSVGTYSVIIRDSLGCVGYDTVMVSATAGPTVAVDNDTIYATPGNVVALGGSPTASGGTAPYTYSWSPTTDLSSHTVANPNLTVSLGSDVYTITVTDSIGCISDTTVLVYGVIPNRVGMSVETSGCPGSLLTICIERPELLVGMEIHLNNILSNCENIYTITEETECIECTIISLYGVPSVTVINPATGLVVYGLENIIVVQ